MGFIAHENLPESDPVTGFIPAPPDLAVEVISPSEARLYLEAGIQAVWNVYPESKAVDVVHLTDDGSLLTHTFGTEDTLSGGDVLPGLQIPVAAIFT